MCLWNAITFAEGGTVWTTGSSVRENVLTQDERNQYISINFVIFVDRVAFTFTISAYLMTLGNSGIDTGSFHIVACFLGNAIVIWGPGCGNSIYWTLPVITTVIHFTTLQRINQRLYLLSSVFLTALPGRRIFTSVSLAPCWTLDSGALLTLSVSVSASVCKPSQPSP
jgi:hypothetical protein